MISAGLGGTASRAGLAAAALVGLFLAGCDEHVQIIRDPDIRIVKHATWAWRPAEPRGLRAAVRWRSTSAARSG